MKLNNSFAYFKSIIIISSIFLFSSCMMFNPGHFSGMHQTSKMGQHSNTSVDPVCGQTIELVQNTLSYQHLNNTYYFHSEECFSQFQLSPDNYLHKQQQKQHGVSTQNGFLWGLGAVAMLGMMALMLF